MRVPIKTYDGIDSAPGKGQSSPVVLPAADMDAFSAKHTAVGIVVPKRVAVIDAGFFEHSIEGFVF